MSTPTTDRSPKICREHLNRMAYIYVRQSTMWQVEHNIESRRRQYSLTGWATELGWPAEHVIMIDEDQGRSSAIADTRAGFERLASAVGRGEVGIVLSLEVSRLARNSPEWHHLMYLCRWTNTLMADEHGVYDLTLSTDRMVLGFRGQFAEMELDTSIHRMVEARWNKAKRGEFLTYTPAGYDIDEMGQIVMTNDEAIQHAIRLVLSKFDELGTARQVFIWWRDEKMLFPVRRVQLPGHPVVWVAPLYRMVLAVLRHPIYAGVYAFGRSQTIHEIDPGDPRKLKVRTRRAYRDEWPVLIKGHHPGYISFEKYEQNRQRILGNEVMGRQSRETKGGPAREGRALLQGLVRCGQCGRRMMVNYGGSRGSDKTTRTLQYRCMGARLTVGGKDCQIVGGKQIDKAVVQAFLEATGPAGVEAALRAEDEVRQQQEAIERHWQLQIEKATYEAQRAERQYNGTEPENRLVARELERRWNERLNALEAVRSQAKAAQEGCRPFTAEERERIRRLGNDLDAVWHAETTTNRDRKRLLRCAVEEVQLRTEENRYSIRVLWKGGLVTDHQAVRFAVGRWCVTPEDTVDLVRKLACEFDDAQIARILNKQGRRSGPGNPFTKANVAHLRRQHEIPACTRTPVRDPKDGPFNADEAAVELGVAAVTVHRWLREGVLPGRQATPGAPWRITLTEDVRRRLSGGEAPSNWVGLTEAAKRLGLSKANVAHRVKAGKLRAVRANVGKRSCWRIDVSSADCGRQSDLFNQMTSQNVEEA
jgi:DNA invertase Pin-like site-specific DNA recombinase